MKSAVPVLDPKHVLDEELTAKDNSGKLALWILHARDHFWGKKEQALHAERVKQVRFFQTYDGAAPSAHDHGLDVIKQFRKGWPQVVRILRLNELKDTSSALSKELYECASKVSERILNTGEPSGKA